MIFIFIGPPGSGKGTQSKILSSLYPNIKLVSVGDLLRARLTDSKDYISKNLKLYMDKGALVPDDMVVDIVFDSIASADPSDLLLLDGFPRNFSQAKCLNKKLLSVNESVGAVFYFNVPLDKLLKRSLGRFICSGCGISYNYYSKKTNSPHVCDSCSSSGFFVRSDDDYQVIIDRLKTYTVSTQPLCDFYKKSSLLIKVDATKSSEEVTKFIITRIKK